MSRQKLPYFTNAALERLNADFLTGLVHGADGELFLLDGPNQPARFNMRVFEAPRYSLENVAANIKARQAYCDARGIAYRAYAFPNKESAMRAAYAPADVDVISIGRDVASSVSVSFVDVPAEIDGKRTFHPGDTHMNAHGEMFAASAMLRDLGIEAAESDFINEFGPLATETFSADLIWRIGQSPMQTREALSNLSRHLSEDNGVINTGNFKVYANPSAPPGALVLFGDSFSWHIAPLFSRFFRTVVFLHSPFFHDELIETVPGVRAVVSASVERFLCRAEPDVARPEAHAYPAYLGKQGESAAGESARMHFERFPNVEQHVVNYARFLARQREFKRALEVMSGVELRDPDSLAAHAQWLGRTGRWDEAIALCERAIALQPAAVEYYLRLGRGYEVTGQREQAHECAMKAFCLKPVAPDTQNFLRNYQSPDSILPQATLALSVTMKARAGGT